MFLASRTRRFVSAKRLFRDLEFKGKLVEHLAQSPVRKGQTIKNLQTGL